MSGQRGHGLGGTGGATEAGHVFGGSFPVQAGGGLSLPHQNMLFRQTVRGESPSIVERRIAAGSITVVDDEDTYIVLNSLGQLEQTVGIAIGGVKPPISDFGPGAQFLARLESEFGDVNVAELLWRQADANLEVISFHSQPQTTSGLIHDTYMPYGGRVIGVQAVVGLDLGLTNPMTITPRIVKNGGRPDSQQLNMTDGVISIPAATERLEMVNSVPTAIRTFAPNDFIRIAVAKPTLPANAHISIVVER